MFECRTFAQGDRSGRGWASRALALAGAVSACYLVVPAQAQAQVAGDTALPRFVDVEGFETLRQSLIARQLAKAAVASGLPSYFSNRASHERMAAGLAPDEIDRPGVAGAGDGLTTADFNSALTGARRDAGEMRALTDELKQSADELSQGLTVTGAIGGAGRPTASPALAAPSAGVDPSSIMPANIQAAMTAADVDATDVASGRPLPGTAADRTGDVEKEAGTPRRRTSHARIDTADPDDERKPRSRQAAGSDRKPAAPAKARVAAPVASPQASPQPGLRVQAQAPAQPQPETPASGGLFSWLKPFTPPRELSAFGWVDNE